MDGSSQLLTSIEFDEARKGYNREQVDGFLRELSGKIAELQDMFRAATQRAEEADARARAAFDARVAADRRRTDVEAALEQAEQARAAAEAALADAQSSATSGAAAHSVVNDQFEAATSVLAMAQRTAEAAVAEAEQRAKQVLDEAELNAAVATLDAEQRAERLRREAVDEAEGLRSERTTMMENEVRELAGQRDLLESDIVDLEDYLAEQRRKIRDGLEALARVVANDGPLVLGEQPQLHAHPLAALEVGADGDDGLPRRENEAEQRALQVPHLLEGPTGFDAEAFATEPGLGADTPAVAAFEPLDGEAVEIDLTTADDAGAGHWDDEPTQAFDALAFGDGTGDGAADGYDVEADEVDEADEVRPPPAFAAGSPLGEPTGGAGEAMRSFFDADDEPGPRRGFLHR